MARSTRAGALRVVAFHPDVVSGARVLGWVAVCAAAAAIGAVAGRAMLPPPRPNGWQQRIQRRFGRGAPEADPFATLALQMRLSRIAAEIDSLHADPDRRTARGFHLRAAMLAYDDLLDEGCRLAGVGVVEGEGAVHRLIAESELRSRGWTW